MKLALQDRLTERHLAHFDCLEDLYIAVEDLENVGFAGAVDRDHQAMRCKQLQLLDLGSMLDELRQQLEAYHTAAVQWV